MGVCIENLKLKDLVNHFIIFHCCTCVEVIPANDFRDLARYSLRFFRESLYQFDLIPIPLNERLNQVKKTTYRSFASNFCYEINLNDFIAQEPR